MSDAISPAGVTSPAGQAGGAPSAPVESAQPAEQEVPASSEGQASGTEPTEQVSEKKAEKSEWVDRRITRLAEQKAAARAQAEMAQRRASELEQRLAKYEQPTPAPAERQIDPYRLAEHLAEVKVRTISFNKAADDLVARGHETYDAGEFDGAVRRLQGLGVVFEDDGSPSMVLNAVMDADSPHEILMHLGQHPDEAESLSRMNPRALIRAVAKLENKISSSPPARVSKAPAPVRPVGGRGGAESGLRDSDDIATWMTKRRQQLSKKR